MVNAAPTDGAGIRARSPPSRLEILSCGLLPIRQLFTLTVIPSRRYRGSHSTPRDPVYRFSCPKDRPLDSEKAVRSSIVRVRCRTILGRCESVLAAVSDTLAYRNVSAKLRVPSAAKKLTEFANRNAAGLDIASSVVGRLIPWII